MVGGNMIPKSLPGWIWRTQEIEKYCRGFGIDIGCGYQPFPSASGVDIQTECIKFMQQVGTVHYVRDAIDLYGIGPATQDFVFSSHCLEHLVDWRDAISEWTRVLKPQGYLVLYLPHKSWEKYLAINEPEHRHDFDFDVIYQELHHRYCLVHGEDEADEWHNFLTVWRKGKAIIEEYAEVE